MNKIKVLSEQDIKKLINLKMTINAVEEAYKQKCSMKGDVWPLVFYEYEHDVFDLDIRSGNLKDSNAYGLKLLSYNENNPKKGLPKVNATAIVCNDQTGEPLAILNAAPITSYRTGSAAAVGAKYLAREDSVNLLVIGTGNIAKYSVAATLYLMPSIKYVYIYNSKRVLSEDEVESFKNDVEKLLDDVNCPLTAKFSYTFNIELTTGMADIIITATPSYEPIIKASWVSKGTHISCMGACMENQQEIDENIFAQAKIFADDEKQCLKYGEGQCANKKGIINKYDGEIGNVILDKIDGRTSKDDITIFDSTGLFLQDLATSMELIKDAKEKNIGIDIDL